MTIKVLSGGTIDVDKLGWYSNYLGAEISKSKWFTGS